MKGIRRKKTRCTGISRKPPESIESPKKSGGYPSGKVKKKKSSEKKKKKQKKIKNLMIRRKMRRHIKEV